LLAETNVKSASSIKIAFFDTKPYDRVSFDAQNLSFGFQLHYFPSHLTEVTVPLCKGYDAVCVFVNDQVTGPVIEALVNGIPAVVAAGTTMAQQIRDFGSGVTCENENIESIVSAISEAVGQQSSLAELANERLHGASEHFSVSKFRKSLQSCE
jgi:glycosyltransferase involved in cell wall biosynthesis